MLAPAAMANPPMKGTTVADHTVRSDSAVTSRSEVIYPLQSIPLRFDHASHLTYDLTCIDCHDKAKDSTSAQDNLLPVEKPCRWCHAIDRKVPQKPAPKGAPPAKCGACHTQQPIVAIRLPQQNLKFSHKAHTATGIDCQTCHGDFSTVGFASRKQLPLMKTCLSCHKDSTGTSRKQPRLLRKSKGTKDAPHAKKAAPGGCVVCHIQQTSGRLQTEFTSGSLTPSGSLRGAAHTPSFALDHSVVAEADPTFCDTCHKKKFCLDCHNSRSRPMKIHPGDYVAMHSVDAIRNTPRCDSCHRRQTFCTGCHSRSGVGSDGKGSEFDSLNVQRRFHPIGWASFGGRGVDHHSWAAQRNIAQCASCHREETCLRCHSGQTLSVNPHPPGWQTSKKCKAMKRRAGRMCSRCHTTGTGFDCL